VVAPVERGLGAARNALRVVEAALREKDIRRPGLGIAFVRIFLTIAGRPVAVRERERPLAQVTGG